MVVIVTIEKLPLLIRRDLYDKIQILLNRNKMGFEKIEEFIELILIEFINDDEKIIIYNTYKEKEEEIKRRLGALGYL